MAGQANPTGQAISLPDFEETIALLTMVMEVIIMVVGAGVLLV